MKVSQNTNVIVISISIPQDPVWHSSLYYSEFIHISCESSMTSTWAKNCELEGRKRKGEGNFGTFPIKSISRALLTKFHMYNDMMTESENTYIWISLII